MAEIEPSLRLSNRSFSKLSKQRILKLEINESSLYNGQSPERAAHIYTQMAELRNKKPRGVSRR
jgi:hypothetical protein